MSKHLREDAIKIWNAAVDSVRARNLVKRWVHCDKHQITIGNNRYDASNFDRVIVVGAGKACTAMAQGLLDQLGDWRPTTGWINVPDGTQLALGSVHAHAARPAGVNEPTAAGVKGTQQILGLVQSASARDLCIVLISGGGSALLPAPCPSITLQDKLQVTQLLSSKGADIIELNTVRKHLSTIKGGGLLRAFRGKQLITLILSDVLGDPVDQIASGPTIPDTTTPSDALQILSRYDADHSLPKRIYETIEEKATMTPSSSHDQCLAQASSANSDANEQNNDTFVIGNNSTAVRNADKEAKQIGYSTTTFSAATSEGSAESVGTDLAKNAIEQLRGKQGEEIISNPEMTNGKKTHKHAFISGGEPTVVLCRKEERGKGGRNQQVILAAYKTLVEAELSEQEWSRVCLISGGTDGEDGPTDAAGALVDHQVHRNAIEQGLSPDNFLKRNDAYTFFEKTRGLLVTGPTGTNVCDVRVLLIV